MTRPSPANMARKITPRPAVAHPAADPREFSAEELTHHQILLERAAELASNADFVYTRENVIDSFTSPSESGTTSLHARLRTLIRSPRFDLYFGTRRDVWILVKTSASMPQSGDPWDRDCYTSAGIAVDEHGNLVYSTLRTRTNSMRASRDAATDVARHVHRPRRVYFITTPGHGPLCPCNECSDTMRVIENLLPGAQKDPDGELEGAAADYADDALSRSIGSGLSAFTGFIHPRDEHGRGLMASASIPSVVAGAPKWRPVFTRDKVTAFTDASGSRNYPSVAGIAGLSTTGDGFAYTVKNVNWAQGGAIQTTELRAIIAAFNRWASHAKHLTIYSDSISCVEAINHIIDRGTAPVAVSHTFTRMLSRLAESVRDYVNLGGTLSVEWVRGHDMTFANNLVDNMARTAAAAGRFNQSLTAGPYADRKNAQIELWRNHISRGDVVVL